MVSKTLSEVFNIWNVTDRSARSAMFRIRLCIWLVLYLVLVICIINPLMPRRTQVSPFHRNFNSILRWDHQKSSYERRAYESVDEKSLSLVMSRKTTEKIIWSIKG